MAYADQKFPPKFPHFSTQISTFVQNFHADVCPSAGFFGYGIVSKLINALIMRPRMATFALMEVGAVRAHVPLQSLILP